MPRTYELGFVVEPRQSDDEVQAQIDRFQGMIESSGAQVTQVDNWGKRKLAYPIQKFNEGKYVFLYVVADGVAVGWTEIERLMQQDEAILRHLVVRTDEDLKRAMRKAKVRPDVPNAEIFLTDEQRAEDAVKAAAAADEKAAADEAAAAESDESDADADDSAEEGDN